MKKNFTLKLLNIMRVCVVQAVIAITLCGVALSHSNYAQLLDREITVELVDLPFERALKEIEKVAQVKFAYSNSQLEDEPNVSLSVEKRTLRHALEALFPARSIRYNVHDKDAVITLKKISSSRGTRSDPGQGAGSEPLRAFVLMQVAGTVTDASTGVPMAGVSVLVKGTTNGTTTDANGYYTVGTEENDVLVFSFIGYGSVEVPVNGRTAIDVTMSEDATNLGEVVVNAGYWEVEDRKRTGSIARVDAKAIENQPVQNPMAAIQGRMTGVYITEDSGTPGSGFRIQIRGRNSLREDGNDPLYVVDGVPYQANTLLQINPTRLLRKPSPLSIINPADIESIEVLKDADATAIYGSRGANGVILISTRKGKGGQTEIEADFQTGVGDIANRMELLNTEQYLEMRMEAFANDGRTPGSADYDLNGAWDKDRYTDWQEILLGGTARFSTAQLNVSGGSANTRFLIGGSHSRQTTVHPGDMGYSRSSLHVNLAHTSDNKKFSINLTTTGGLEDNNLSPVSFFDVIYQLPPNAPALYAEDGRINWQGGSWNNPVANLESDYNARTFSSLSSLQIAYKVLDKVTIKSRLGYNNTNVRERSLSPISALNPASPNLTGSARFSTTSGTTWIAEPQVEYLTDVGRGVLTALLGGTFQDNTTESVTVNAEGIENDELLYNIASAPAGEIVAGNYYSQYRYIALFGRVHYDYEDRYILNLTGRRDGSSRFGPGRQFANFGAVGIAWILSNEKFFRNVFPFFSFTKLRTSYGITGSDQIGNYGYLDTYSNVILWDQYEGKPTLVPSRLANPDYGWESNEKLEFGLEFGLLKDRISLGTSYYRNRSSSQLVGLPLPATTGFSSIQYNLPATVQNTGWEFEIESSNIQSGGLTWSTSVNLTIPRNELIEYPNLDISPNAKRYKVGEPIEGFSYAYDYTQIDSETGIYQFTDLDESGTISSGDQIATFVRGLNYYGGIVNSITFKGFQLEVMLHFTDRKSSSHLTWFSTPGAMAPQPVEVLNRWQESGDIKDIQKFATRGAAFTAQTTWESSDGNVDNLSFMRVKNLSISWQFPERWLSRLSVKQSKIYLQGRNLVTFTDYKGLDPETNAGAPLRMMSVGLQATF